MNYTLYICNHCLSCERVISFLRERSIRLKEVNLDADKGEDLPPLLVVPALLSDGKIIAYGADIIEYLDIHNK